MMLRVMGAADVDNDGKRQGVETERAAEEGEYGRLWRGKEVSSTMKMAYLTKYGVRKMAYATKDGVRIKSCVEQVVCDADETERSMNEGEEVMIARS